MDITVLGLSHKTAPVEVREKLSFSTNKVQDALRMLLNNDQVAEAVIISTCNRTEIYSVIKDENKGKKSVVSFLEQYSGLKKSKLDKYLYFYKGDHAIHHLFNVSASLDSMIVGEAQILGQVKEAYALAETCEATDIIFNRLFRRSFSVGKRIRTETTIGESAVSVSYAAAQLAKKVFEELKDNTVMILGAGEMSELTVRHLVENGISSVLVSNRTFERAEKLAKEFKGRAVKFDDRHDEMVKADIIISSTSAPHYIVSKDELSAVMKKRKHRPIFIIDISVPRDIDPQVNKLENVYLYDIDDLEKVVEDNKSQRLTAARQGEKIINEEKKQFTAWLSSLEVTPTIAEIKDKAEKIKAEELEKALSKLHDVSEHDKEHIKALSSVIINRILHEPIVNLKELTNEKDGYTYIESLRHLFSLGKKK